MIPGWGVIAGMINLLLAGVLSSGPAHDQHLAQAATARRLWTDPGPDIHSRDIPFRQSVHMWKEILCQKNHVCYHHINKKT